MAQSGGHDMTLDGKWQIASASWFVYVSSDYGQTWKENYIQYSQYLGCCALSATGQYQIVASTNNYGVYMSSDYGNTWIRRGLISGNARSASISATGQYQTVAIYDASIYISSDYGNTWEPKGTDQYWESVAVNRYSPEYL